MEKVVESFLQQWLDYNNHSILTLLIEEDYLKAATSFLVGAGAIEATDGKTQKLCLKFIEGYTFDNEEADIDACLNHVNPAIFLDINTNEYYWVRNKADFVHTDTTKFIGYWDNGRIFSSVNWR